MKIRLFSLSYVLLILSYVTAILSSVFALLALRTSGSRPTIDEMLTMFFFLSVPNLPSLAAATLAIKGSRRSSGLWLAASLIVAVPICAIWLLLSIFPVAKSGPGPVPSMLPGDEAMAIVLHVALASIAFVFVAICDLAISIKHNNS